MGTLDSWAFRAKRRQGRRVTSPELLNSFFLPCFVQNLVSRSSLGCEWKTKNDKRRSAAPKPVETEKKV